MPAFVIDTNVPVAANGKSHADPACVTTCIDALLNVYSRGVIVIDDGMRILREYLDNLSLSGQPGPGDVFVKWVWSNQADEQHCERVPLTSRIKDAGEDFEEFPEDAELRAFDRADRKFVAVAIASRLGPEILNALDSDWADHRDALVRHGLVIRCLCPQHVRC